MDADESIDTLHRDAVSADTLLRELEHTVENGTDWAENMRIAEDTTWCIWPGQTDDGLKHAMPGDEEPPFPWENSSDTRIRLVDEKVREHTRLAALSIKRGNWTFQGVEGDDFLAARQKSQLLRWQEATQIPGARRQKNLWLYWGAQYGCSIMGMGWKQKEATGLERVTVADLQQAFYAHLDVQVDNAGNPVEMSPDQAQYLETLAFMLEDDTAELEWLEEWLGFFFPEVSAKTLKKAAKELQATGETELPQKRVVASHPTLQAMRPMVDVFFPLDTCTMRDARWAATRRWMSKPEVEAMRGTWPAKFINELLKHEGACSTIGIDTYLPSDYAGRKRWNSGRQRGAFSTQYDRRGLYEVFYFYHHSVDADGVSGLYQTVCSPHVRDHKGAILAEQAIYDTGLSAPPFEEYTIWDDAQELLSCRGIPHWLYTYQYEKKDLRDSRQNVTKLSVLPPIRRHFRDKNIPIVLGPDMPIYENVPGSTKWMDPPKNNTGMAMDLERTIDREANRFIGSYDNEVPEPVVQIAQEFGTDQSNEAYGRVLSRVMMLNQCYLDEATVTRLTGFIDQPFKVTRTEIQGQFDFQITFDPRELNIEFAMKKFKAVSDIATQLDTGQITDRNALVKKGYAMIDPAWADELVQDEHKADAQEIRETRNAINDITSGQQPQLTDQMNSKLRLEYFTEQLQVNPVLANIQANPEDPRNETLQRYQQHLEHIYHQQYLAAGEGRMGVKMEG